jgi:hypothetical protein
MKHLTNAFTVISLFGTCYSKYVVQTQSPILGGVLLVVFDTTTQPQIASRASPKSAAQATSTPARGKQHPPGTNIPT